jgi:hypothetical protein
MGKPDTEPQKDNQYEDRKYPYNKCYRYRIPHWCFELSAAIVAEWKATDRAGVGILREGPIASSNLSQMFYSICRKTVSIYVIFQIRDARLNPMLETILMR